MPLELHEVTSADEFADVIHCEWVANETPWNGMIEVFCPTLGTGPKARQDSMKESTDRQWMWHESDPSSTWLNVIDTDLDTATATTTDGAKPEGGKVVAAAKWHIYKEDPFVDPASRSIEAYWWPEGEGRTFATTTLNNMMAQRVRYTRFPHVFLEIMFTHPSHRRRGAGSLLMDWGIKKADSLGLEAFMQATELGKLLYGNYGFQPIEDMDFTAPMTREKEKSEELKALEEKVGAVRCWFMRRLVGGKMG